MNRYSSKYGFDCEADAIQSFHKQRRMFVIKDDVLQIAPVGSPLSHAEWFENLGWMSPEHDVLMEELTRGYVDSTGVYAYTGYDFRFTETVERDFSKHVDELSKIMELLPKTYVYFGLTKPTLTNPKWEPTKRIGTIESLVFGKFGKD